MKVTRKGFITSLGATVVVVSALPFDRVFGRTHVPPEPNGVGSFAPLVGSEFHALGPGGQRVSMILREVIELPGDPRIEQFSLVFKPGRRSSIPSGTYDVEHPSLGAFHLFLTASGNNLTGGGALARADFSLLRV